MQTEIDALSISIEAKAQKANSSIDKLVSRLDVLSNSLGKIGNAGNNISNLGAGVERLARGMQGFKGVGEAKFVKLANGINQLSNINTQGISNAARSLQQISSAFERVGGMSGNAVQVADLAKNLGKLGNKSVTNAIANIPKLATAMNNLMTTLSKAPKVSENVIRMTNALANLSAQGSKVGSASNSISKGLNRASNSATRARASFGGLASVIGKFYATYFLLIRAFKGLGNAIGSTADYLEAFNYFNVALGKIGSDWSHQFEQYGYESAEAYADSFSTRLQQRLSGLSGLSIQMNADGTGLLTETGLQNLGLNLQEVTQYASQLASVTNSVGQTGEVSLATASSITKLGSDLSSLFNLDYADVMQNLQSGLIGQSRALYKYGIDITNATLQTYAYELGLEKAVSEMTQAEKMQLRILAILDQSKVAWGDLANTINSPSNMMRQFSNNVKEVGMVLGQLFIPVLQKVMPIINGVTIAIKRLLVSIASLLGINLDLSSFGQGYSGIEEEMEDVADSFDNATASAKKFKTYTLGIDELNIQPEQADSSGSGGGGGVGEQIDLTDEILQATEEYEKIWQEAFDKMENTAQQWADKIQEFFKPITDPFANLDWETITANIKELTVALEPWSENFAEGFIGFWGDISQIGANAIEKIFGEKGAATKLTDWLNDNDPERAEKWGRAFGWLSLGLMSFAALTGISGTIATLGKVLGFVFSPIKSLLGLGSKVAGLLGLTAALESLGGLGGLLTMDLALIFGAGTALEIGLTIGVGIIGGILAAWGGFNFGKFIGKLLNPDDKQWYENFKFFGEDGFFKTISKDWFTTIYAIGSMMTDYANFWAELILGVENAFIHPYEFGKKIGAYIKEEIVQPIKEAITIIEEWFTKEKWEELFNNTKTVISTWFTEDVQPWFTAEKWQELFENAKIGLQTKWDEIVEWWNGSAIGNWFNQSVKPWFSKEKWSNLLSSIPEVFSQAFKSGANLAIGFLNKIIEGIESLINGAIRALSTAEDLLNKIPGIELSFNIPEITLPRIPTYQTGGFPEDGLFMANRGELVGKFSNGKTAVANNEQIVAGIEYGVERAVERALAPYLSDIARNTRETADKDMSVNIGDRDIARANARGSKS